jgi:hypothetical protein
MKTYLYTPKPTLVLKKLKSGARLRAELDEIQLIQSTPHARILYDPDHGILVETENSTGLEEVEALFKEKKLPLVYEGKNLLLGTHETGFVILNDLRCQPESPENTDTTSHQC